jgi:sugar lactone lactonase YvrE
MKNVFCFGKLIAIALLLSANAAFAQSGNIYTVAGGGSSSADDIPATSAYFINTSGVCVDPSGFIYVADYSYCVVKKIDPATGLIHYVAGIGTPGFSGDGGSAKSAQLSNPRGICSDASGNIYVADGGNHRIRKINVSTGIISTVAGGGSSLADGVPAVSASIDAYSVYVDPYGNIYTGGNNELRKIDAKTGMINTVAGNGLTGDAGDSGPALLTTISGAPECIQMDAAGNIYFIALSENRIRKIDFYTGIITTVAGGGIATTDGVPATSEEFSAMHNFTVDAVGNLYIADYSRNILRFADAATGMLTTIAGTGTLTAEGAPALSSKVIPYSMAIDPQTHNVLYSDFSTKVRQFSYNVPGWTGNITKSSDSFFLSADWECTAPQFTTNISAYSASMSLKTNFGDGITNTSPVSPAYYGGGYVRLDHTYPNSGAYTIKEVLYQGASPVDSLHLTYNYKPCNAITVRFYMDENGNGTRDKNEPYNAQPVLTEIDSNGISVGTISSTSGFYYTAYGNSGDVYSFKIMSAPSGLVLSAPSSGIIYDTLLQSPYNTNEIRFGISCGPNFDLSVNTWTPVTGIHDQWGHIYVSNPFVPVRLW